MHGIRAAGRSPRHHVIAVFLPFVWCHAALEPSLNCDRARPPSCSGRGKLTLRSNNPFFRSTAVRATPSGTPRMGFGSRTVPTAPSSLRHGRRGRAARTKPEVLHSVGFGRTERRVIFEAKEPSVFQVAIRNGTGRITTLGHHNGTFFGQIALTDDHIPGGVA